MINEREKRFGLGHMLPVIAGNVGLMDNAKYARALQIKPSEYKRYFKKTLNLAICYAGFAQNLSLNQARGAGHSAFLSCAYDVVTDWEKPVEVQYEYARILDSETSPELANMALGLLDRDARGVLLEDGLERGVVAIEFVLQTMGIKEIIGIKCDIKRLGSNMQIVDDVLDYEDDSKLGDQNCLSNVTNRELYLRRLLGELDDQTLHNLFPYGRALTFAIKKARCKATDMLAAPQEYFL